MGYIGENEETVKRELHPFPDEVPEPEQVPAPEPEKVPAGFAGEFGEFDTWT